MILHGDVRDKLKELKDNSVDSIVCDPPYEIGFKHKGWDSTGIAYNEDMWKDTLRVLKPGGLLVAFSSARTYHRMAVAVENSGYEIIEMFEWIYATGFPKSLDIAKAIDKLKGEKPDKVVPATGVGFMNDKDDGWNNTKNRLIYDSAKSEEAKKWVGYKTAIKPAHEPCVIARKPLSEKTYAENILKWGTGAYNIDGSRIETTDVLKEGKAKGTNGNGRVYNDYPTDGTYTPSELGRYPSNIIISEDITPILEENNAAKFFLNVENEPPFYYCPKAGTSERGEDNTHPTVKPKKLIKYLVKLCTPKNGTSLDIFSGSGTHGVACKELTEEGYPVNYIEIEKEKEYIDIIKKRLDIK